MKIVNTKIEGVYLFNPNLHQDNRGIFRRHFCQKDMKKFLKGSTIKQANLSFNPFIYTLRGFHYQKGKASEGKILSCLEGKIFDTIIDLRKKSKTYLKHVSFILSKKNYNSISVPKGCANAFLTLKKNTLVHYYCTNYYNPNFESGIRFDDPCFRVKWPHKPKIISEKDLNWKDYKY